MQCYEYEIVREFMRQQILGCNPNARIDELALAEVLADARIESWLDVTRAKSHEIDHIVTMLADALPAAA